MRVSSSIGRLLLVVVAVGTVGCGMERARPPAAHPPEAEAVVAGPYLVLKLGERRLYVMDDKAKAPKESFRVAIGRERYPTPTGHFQVNEMVMNPDFAVFDFGNPTSPIRGRVPPGPNSPLGLRWIGFASAHGWTIGFHGTARTELLGQAVSHGCVRMRNEDVVKLYDEIKLGTPVIVEP